MEIQRILSRLIILILFLNVQVSAITMPNWLKRIFPTHSRRSTPVESWRPTRENVHVPKSVPMKPFMRKPFGIKEPRPYSPELDRYNPRATARRPSPNPTGYQPTPPTVHKSIQSSQSHSRTQSSPHVKKNERKQVRFSEKNQVFFIPPRAQIARENMGAQHR